MGLGLDNPFVETGDRLQEFESWRLDGVNEINSDRGRLYVISDAGTVTLYRQRPRVNVPPPASEQVAAGVGGTGWVELTAVNASGLTGLVKRNAAQTTSGIVVFKWLCGPDDLRRFDDLVDGLHIEGEVDWKEPLDEMMRQFLVHFASIYPPPPGVSAPLRFTATEIEDGREGTPEWAAQYFWSLSGEGEWEMTGLQNAGDYRTMAVYKTLSIIYERKARAGDGTDPVFSRMEHFKERAMKAWYETRPWVDIDGDNLPDRAPKTRTSRLRRG